MRAAFLAVYVYVVLSEVTRKAIGAVPQVADRPNDLPACEHPKKGAGVAYEPVCPAGYYRCCATCSEARCYGTVPMELSWRGIPECIKCAAGDYCEGCDIFKTCPVSTQPGREGQRVTRAGSARLADCEACPREMEASIDNAVCVATWTHECDKNWLRRCIRGCESPDILRRKRLTGCELMKCSMYCARSWSDGCAAAVGNYCMQKTKKFPEDNSLAVSVEEMEYIEDCDVNCNGSQHGCSFCLAVIVPAIWLLMRVSSAER